jgi:hypothetical protein
MSDVDVKIVEIANRLGIADPDWLTRLIALESGFNPLAKNPNSSARGLIQIIDSTARDIFGFPDSLSLISKYPDFDSQMDNVVFPYLRKYAPFPTKQSLYMAVFFPVARFVAPDTTFDALFEQKRIGGDKWQQRLAEFHAANGDIKTVQDYIDKVEGRAALIVGGGLAALLAIAALAWVILRGGFR